MGYSPETNLRIATVHEKDSPRKFENGFQIFWRDTADPGNPHPNEADPEAAIEVFDRSGKELAICRVAPAIRSSDPAFSGVSIYDVSARKPVFIAVAAVYTRKEGGPIALLLYFNWDGSLLHKIVLDDLSEIQSLEIDNAGHVWTLNDFERDVPAKSVFTEFDSADSVIGRFLKPRRHWSTAEGDLKGGQNLLA